jgi:hypothetical protein
MVPMGWKCGKCGGACTPFEPRCLDCGAQNPDYSPLNKWAAGGLGAALATFAIWLVFQDVFSIPTRGGTRNVYQGWSVLGLAAQALAPGVAFLGLAMFGAPFRKIAFGCVGIMVILWIADIAVRAMGD